MKKFFLSLILLASVASGQTIHDYARFIERWEGRRASAYVCPAGFNTIGVGHRVMNGENFSRLTNKQIDSLLLRDTVSAYVSARRNIKNFDSLPRDIKLIVVDMNYNLGERGFSKFKKTIAAIESNNFAVASREMKNALWYKQTGRRARHHVSTMRNVQ